REELRHLLECRILLDQTAVHARHETVHLIAELGLRQRDDRRVLPELVGRHRLAVAVDVERRRDDLALLLRERAYLLVAASASATGVRLGALELFPQRTNLQEIEIARRPFRAGHGVVVRRA